MNRLTTFAILSEIASATLNRLQDIVLGFTEADTGTGGYTNEWTEEGAHGVHFQSAVGLPSGEPVTLDVSRDWRKSVVTGWLRTTSTLGQRIDGASDYLLNDLATGPSNAAVWVYTGSGAYHDITVGSGGEVAVGDPPVNGSNVRPSYAGVVLDGGAGAVVWLFADPSTGYLKAYNATGSALYCLFGLVGARAVA